jgi:hypothetical protein
MSHVRRFDHVGLTVADLDVMTAFFIALGLEFEGRTFVEGEFLDTVCGIPDSRTEIVMLKPPDPDMGPSVDAFGCVSHGVPIRPCMTPSRRYTGPPACPTSIRVCRWQIPLAGGLGAGLARAHVGAGCPGRAGRLERRCADRW